MKEETEKT